MYCEGSSPSFSAKEKAPKSLEKPVISGLFLCFSAFLSEWPFFEKGTKRHDWAWKLLMKMLTKNRAFNSAHSVPERAARRASKNSFMALSAALASVSNR